ncbi:MAG TPA: hypothetical protein VLQ79_03485 [Myxococcaceae bacterium]|nr:hypothetical protein [Myxococcaceae bacterium]
MTVTHVAARPRISAEHAFFVAMSFLLLALVCSGFSRTFLLHRWFPEVRAPAEPFFAIHGIVFLGWFVLLAVQSGLVAQRRVALHRSLGVLGGVLATVMVVLGITGAVIAGRRTGGFTGVPVPPLQFMAIPFFDMVVFSSTIGTAFALRRDLQAHKRLMLIGSIAIITAALARFPAIFRLGPPAFFGLTDLLLLPIVAWDVVSRRRLHPATLWAGLGLVISQPLRLVVSGSTGWVTFARWLTGLAG